MYGPKDRKKASLSNSVLSSDGRRVSCIQICPHAPCVYYSVVQWPDAQLFHAGHRNNTLVVENVCFFSTFTFHMSLHTLALKSPFTLVFTSMSSVVQISLGSLFYIV